MATVVLPDNQLIITYKTSPYSLLQQALVVIMFVCPSVKAVSQIMMMMIIMIMLMTMIVTSSHSFIRPSSGLH